jgi:hypothetical protein
VAGLKQAVSGADDYERRIDGAAVDWSRDWEESLNPDVMKRIMALLAAC